MPVLYLYERGHALTIPDSKKAWKKKKGLKAYTMGYLAEIGALLWFSLRGYSLLGRRYRTTRGEIDLIMRHGRTIVFVEVKYRTTLDEAVSSITCAQKRRILGASQRWLAYHPWASDYTHRYDALCFGPPFQKQCIAHIPAIVISE